MRFLPRTDPVARLAATLVLVAPLTFTLDLVSAGVALGLSVLLLLLDGFPILRLLKIIAALLLIVPFAGLSMLLYAEPGGRIWFRFLAATISDNSFRLALASMARTLAMTVPVLAVFSTIDPTRLADSLAQIVRLPARLVLGSFAGLRMLGLFVAGWRALGQARRARGLGDGGRLRRWLTMSFALLVFALRRGTKLATAMEARGFGAGARTWARPSRWRWADTVLVGLGAAISALAIWVAIATGSFYAFWS